MKAIATIIVFVVLLLSIGIPIGIVSRTVYFPMTITDLTYLAGKLFGLTAFLVVTFQYMWTAKIRLLEKLRSYDGRVAVHRTLGFLGILVLCLHPVFILGTYAAQQIPLVIDLPTALGFLSLLLLLLIAGSTFLGRIWRVRYEAWKRLHWFTFPVLTLAFFHSLALGSDLYGGVRYLWIVLWGLHLAVLLYKAIHKTRTWLRIRKVLAVRPEAQNITSLTFEKTGEHYFPGQFGFISFKFGNRWESWHPFSLTSNPGEDHVSMTIKGLGDFSNQVAQVKAGDPVKLDIGYGAFSPSAAPDTRYTFVAGGVGVTPIYGILKELKERQDPPEVVMMYCVHHETDILFRGDLDNWFSDNPKWQINYICTSQPDWKGIKGRLTPEVFTSLCGNNLRGTYFLCGPAGMVGSIVEHLRSQGVPKRRIKREQFVFLP